MSFRWNHIVVALALAGATVFVAPAASAHLPPQATERREARPGTRRDIRQDQRQLRRKRHDIHRDTRRLRRTRRMYGPGSRQARFARRDVHRDVRSYRRLRRDRNRDVRIHRRRVARRVAPRAGH